MGDGTAEIYLDIPIWNMEWNRKHAVLVGKGMVWHMAGKGDRVTLSSTGLNYRRLPQIAASLRQFVAILCEFAHGISTDFNQFCMEF